MNYIIRILRSARELWRYYAFISALTVFLSLLTLLQPLLSGMAIDEIRLGTDANVTYVVLLAVGIFILDLLSTLFNNVNGYLGDQMSARLNKILAGRYFEHLLSLPQSYFDRELSGKIINRLNRSIVQITNFMQMMSNNFLQFIFSTVFSLVVVALFSWQVALLLFLLYPIYIWMTMRSSNTWQKYQEEKNRHSDIATGRFTEAISQVKVVKSYIQEPRELGFFDRHFQKTVDINKPQSRYWHVKDVQRRLILNVIFLLVNIFIFVQAVQGILTPGQAVTLILYALQIRIPIFTISFLVENTQRAISDSKDYFEVMDELPHISDDKGAPDLTVHEGNIRFENVHFGYDKDHMVLKDVSFEVEKDSKVALVGESGEGKTTITNLLMRLYEPIRGSIRIDGQDINEVTQQSLRSSIAVVFQDPALFSGTIKENIGYARADASDKEIIKAAKAANAHEFISRFDKGYDTEIGERGLKLSGGQKQRIAIARAILKDAPILILDEATSSLDSRSEVLVQEALEHLMKGRTVLIIAHRLSTIKHVDQIITLRRGRVDEVGSPRELAKSGGIYSQLLKIQQGKDTETAKAKLRSFEIEVNGK